ncbi:MAG: Fic family protein [Nitrososphaerales archaeon]
MMKRSGLLSRVRAVPDVSLFELDRSWVGISMDKDTKRRLEQKIRFLDFIELVRMGQHYDPPPSDPRKPYNAALEIVHRAGELESYVDLTRELIGDFDLLESGKSSRLHAREAISPKCLELLVELVRDPFGKIQALGSRCNVSEKTAARYISSLLRARAFSFDPLLNARKTGSIVFVVDVLVRTTGKGMDRGDEESIHDTTLMLKNGVLQDCWVSENRDFAGHAVVHCFAPNLAEVDRLSDSVRSEKPFRNASFMIGCECLDNQKHARYLKLVSGEESTARRARQRSRRTTTEVLALKSANSASLAPLS